MEERVAVFSPTCGAAVSWIKAEDSHVSQGEEIAFTVESKGTKAILAPASGTLVELQAGPAKCGSPIAFVRRDR